MTKGRVITNKGILIFSGTFLPAAVHFTALTNRTIAGMPTAISTIYGTYHGKDIYLFKKFGAAEFDELKETANAAIGDIAE